MKPALVNAYGVMLPRLQAEEHLALRGAVASGTGSMSKQDDRKFISGLRKIAGRGEEQKVRTVGDLIRTGIPVIRRKKGDG